MAPEVQALAVGRSPEAPCSAPLPAQMELLCVTAIELSLLFFQPLGLSLGCMRAFHAAACIHTDDGCSAGDLGHLQGSFRL
jgi:ABC-type antimicrobial peptide transport system permease subunit